jgi:hypothetical protein
MGDVENLLVLEGNRKQGCFSGLQLKEVQLFVWNDESLRHLNSAKLASIQITSCHCWSLMKTELEGTVTAGV